MNLKSPLRFTLALLALASTARAQLTFQTNAYFVDPSFYSVAAADLNGDGKADIIADCQNLSTLVILTNNGHGLFGSNSIIKPTTFPNTVGSPAITTDVNGDGKQDLVWVSPFVTLVIATNNGSGVFGLHSSVGVGSGNSEFGLAAADVNNDGKIDLICANGIDGKVYVLTNNGDGFFTSYATLSAGNNPESVAVADINGDGKPDVIAANCGTFQGWGTTVTIFTNNGTGFGFKANTTVGSGPISIVAADINADGSPDLITANVNGGSLTVLTNNGHGTFGLHATLPDPTAASVVAADFNGDGKIDLACANDIQRTVIIFTNNGTGDFGSNTTLSASSNPSDYTDWLVTADVDGDGQMDLVAANQNYSGGAVNATVAVFTQTAINPPALAISTTNSTSLGITWTTPSTTFILETNSSLSGPNWAPASYPITTNGQSRNLLLPSPPAGNLYFRLKR